MIGCTCERKQPRMMPETLTPRVGSDRTRYERKAPSFQAATANSYTGKTFAISFPLIMNAQPTCAYRTPIFWPILLAILLFSFAACNRTTAIEGAAAPSLPPQSPQSTAAETREMTFYTAKQAFGRLTLDLQARKQPLPKQIWYAIPERSAILSYGDGTEWH